MAKYRKKPVVIDAFKWTGDVHQIEDLAWIAEAMKKPPGTVGRIGFWSVGTERVMMEIKTLEGTMRASRGDWIIRGVNGQIYPCKPDVFEAIYEKV